MGDDKKTGLELIQEARDKQLSRYGFWDLFESRYRKSEIERLAIAGALIAAEIDRLQQHLADYEKSARTEPTGLQ